MSRIFSFLIAIMLGVGVAYASTDSVAYTPKYDSKIFNHLDVGLTLGTTGFGLDLAMPATEWATVRAGVSYMPSFDVPLHLNLMNYSNAAESTFDKAAELMKNLTGYEIDREVTVNGSPDFLNFKLMVDLHLFKNVELLKNWHVTAGFFFGPEKAATALNAMGEMTTLVSVGMFNSMYDFMDGERYLDEPLYGSYYISPETGDALRDKFRSIGRIGVGLGTFTHTMYKDLHTNQYSDVAPGGQEGVDYAVCQKGDRYIMLPDVDATVSAKALANKFRPYLGIGYGGHLDKAKKFNVSVECGAMFWGGAPRVETHEGVDLLNDVEGVPGKVGDYVDMAKDMKVYPVLNFRISYNIF